MPSSTHGARVAGGWVRLRRLSALPVSSSSSEPWDSRCIGGGIPSKADARRWWCSNRGEAARTPVGCGGSWELEWFRIEGFWGVADLFVPPPVAVTYTHAPLPPCKIPHIYTVCLLQGGVCTLTVPPTTSASSVYPESRLTGAMCVGCSPHCCPHVVSPVCWFR
jgi:hypothetical protein